MSSISDTTSFAARFFAFNCAQSVDFHRFWWFFGHFCGLKAPSSGLRPPSPEGRRSYDARTVRGDAYFARFSPRDFQTACFT
ncbi:MAG: hypothetical protein WEB58_14465 [Planctomycetaceae bacterium]